MRNPIRFFGFFKFDIMGKLTALKEKQTYFFLLSGCMLVIGLICTPLNYLFYLSFVYPSYMVYKGKVSQTTRFFYYVLPYYLLLGFGVWENIFPYYLGILLAILIADPISKILYKIYTVLIRTKSKYLKLFLLPFYFFVYDYIFQNIWPLQSVEMIPFLSPVYNHAFILRIASIVGSHVTLLIIISVISAISAAAAIASERETTGKNMLVMIGKNILIAFCGLLLIITPNFIPVHKNNNNQNLKSVKVAAVQGKIEFDKTFENAGDYGEFVLSSYRNIIGDNEADIFVFPEFVFGLYDKSGIMDAENRTQFQEFAREKDALALFTVTELDSETNAKEDRFITSLLVSPEGIIGKSSKRNLVPFSESKRYSKGNNYEVFDTMYSKIGVSICYDTNHKTVEKLKKNGAELILAPFNDSGFGRVFHNIHRFYPVIKALQCNVPIAVSNYDGISQLIDSNGNVVKQLEYGEKGVICCELTVSSSMSYYLIFGIYLETILFLGTLLLLFLYSISHKMKA